jgi:hypothetical protein
MKKQVQSLQKFQDLIFLAIFSKFFDSSVKYLYSEEIRAELLTSLNKRFSNIINQDIR